MVAASSQLLPVSPQSAAGDFVAHVFETRLFEARPFETDDFEMRFFENRDFDPRTCDAQDSTPGFAEATIAYVATRARPEIGAADGAGRDACEEAREALAARMLDLARTMRIGAIEERAREAAHAATAALRVAALRPRFRLREARARMQALDAARENADAS